MKEILITDNLDLITEEIIKNYSEVWTLVDTDKTEIFGKPIYNIKEITMTTNNHGEKFREILAEIYKKYSYNYKVLTSDKKQYEVTNYICDFVN